MPETTSTDTRHEAFAYDDCGNIKSKDGRTFINRGWQLDQVKDANTGVTEFTFKYSDDGHMVSKIDATGKNTASMKYDSAGHLVGLNATSFVYDYGGRIIKAVLPNGNVRIYPSQTYEVDISVSGDVTHAAYLVHGYRRALLSTTAKSSDVNYFHTDHLGSTTTVSNSHGDIVTEYVYDSFGQVVSTSGDDIARYKFSGKEMFDGLYYFGSRFYDPDVSSPSFGFSSLTRQITQIGRFLTLDSYPVDVQNAIPSTFNMYSFSRNDPVNFVDMNGNVPWWHWFVASSQSIWILLLMLSSRLIDAVLIAVGVALIFVPGVNGVALSLMVAAISGALLSGGLAGGAYDLNALTTGSKSDDQEWGMAVGVGALFGAISGGLSAGVDALVPAVTIVDVSENAGAIGVRMTAGFVVKTVSRVAVKTVMQTGLGELKQMSLNGLEGKRWDADLGEVAINGAIHNVITNCTCFVESPLKPCHSTSPFFKSLGRSR